MTIMGTGFEPLTGMKNQEVTAKNKERPVMEPGLPLLVLGLARQTVPKYNH